jgi:hypothetical protein
MRIWFAAAGVILLIVYLMPMQRQPGLPSFGTLQTKMGDKPGAGPYIPPNYRRPVAARQDCVFPPTGETALVAFVQGYRGQGASSVAIGSEDEETTTAELVIEAGERPLYIVLLMHGPVIWRVSGDTGRVRNLVLTGMRGGKEIATRAGVTGLSRERVTFVYSHCLVGDVLQKDYLAQMFRLYVGREPDLVMQHEAVARISLPSGEVVAGRAKPPWWQSRGNPSALLWYLGLDRDGRAGLRRQVNLRYPAGIVEIDPGMIVSNSPLRNYTVLPGPAGLQQLVEEGAVDAIGHDEFRIRRKIRLPAGLNAGTFLLPKDIPTPDGIPGSVCVISEETGRPAHGFDRALC